MPICSDPRYELFAQLVANNSPTGEAYKAVGRRPTGPRKNNLLRRPEVRERIAELQAIAAGSQEVTREALIAAAADIQLQALALKRLSTALDALIVKAKLAGLWPDGKEVTLPKRDYVICGEPLSEEEWIARHVGPD